LYMMHNRFNTGTELKVKESVYLENAKGEIFEWNPFENNELRILARLSEPAKMRTSGIETILFPLDTKKDAYRVSEDFKYTTTRNGIFADIYNRNCPSERAAYQ